MKRKEFLLATIAAVPLHALQQPNTKSTNAKKPFVVRAGSSRFNKPLKFRGIHPNDIIVSRKDTDDALSIFAYTGFAKIGPPLHVHYNQDEIFTVLAGKYRFVVGEETMELNVGDTVFLPRNIPHTWIQLTDVGKLTYMAQPAGTLEDFFQEMNDLKNRPQNQKYKKYM